LIRVDTRRVQWFRLSRTWTRADDATFKGTGNRPRLLLPRNGDVKHAVALIAAFMIGAGTVWLATAPNERPKQTQAFHGGTRETDPPTLEEKHAALLASHANLQRENERLKTLLFTMEDENAALREQLNRDCFR
jgi:dienelactone hydrolase